MSEQLGGSKMKPDRSSSLLCSAIFLPNIIAQIIEPDFQTNQQLQQDYEDHLQEFPALVSSKEFNCAFSSVSARASRFLQPDVQWQMD